MSDTKKKLDKAMSELQELYKTAIRLSEEIEPLEGYARAFKADVLLSEAVMGLRTQEMRDATTTKILQQDEKYIRYMTLKSLIRNNWTLIECWREVTADLRALLYAESGKGGLNGDHRETARPQKESEDLQDF